MLLLAQQGAVFHELSHVVDSQGCELRGGPDGNSDALCAQCPAFAQVVTPAFSHPFHSPLPALSVAQRAVELDIAAIEAAVPNPRSRGPPSIS